jgi:hypothetical protein
MKFLFGLAVAGALLGGAILVIGLTFSNGAPQEAAVAGIAVAFAVLPYCLARSAHMYESASAMRDQTRLLTSIENKLSSRPATHT